MVSIKKILKKRLSVKIALLFLCVFLVYLLLPTPNEPPPPPDSLRSTEPGDTVEIPGLFAYYTNLSRGEIIDFYQGHYSRSSFLNIPLPGFKLNHPPEYAYEAIRDTIHSSYLEEIVHPMRESFYINGYEPANDPFATTDQTGKVFKVEGQEFTGKVIVIHKGSNPFLRIIVLLGIILATVVLVKEVGKIGRSFSRRR